MATAESIVSDMQRELKKIHDEHKKTFEKVKSSVDKESMPWKCYLDYVSDRVIKGLVEILITSLERLCDILDPNMYKKGDNFPLFEIKADIEEKMITFDPEFDYTPDQTGLCDIVNGWITDFFKICTLIARVDSMKGAGGDYLQEVCETFRVKQYLSKVSWFMNQTNSKCEEFKNSFNE